MKYSIKPGLTKMFGMWYERGEGRIYAKGYGGRKSPTEVAVSEAGAEAIQQMMELNRGKEVRLTIIANADEAARMVMHLGIDLLADGERRIDEADSCFEVCAVLVASDESTGEPFNWNFRLIVSEMPMIPIDSVLSRYRTAA